MTILHALIYNHKRLKKVASPTCFPRCLGDKTYGYVTKHVLFTYYRLLSSILHKSTLIFAFSPYPNLVSTCKTNLLTISFGQELPHVPQHAILPLLPPFLLSFWTAGHSVLFSGGSGGMTSGLNALRTTVMKDSMLPTTYCISPVDNLQLSGSRPDGSSGAAINGLGLQ